MSERLKRVLLVLAFTTVVIGIGFAIYLVFFRPIVSTPTTTGPSEGGGTTETGTLPTSGTSTGRMPGEGASAGGAELPGAETISETMGATGTTSEKTRTSLLVEGSTSNISPTPDGSGARFYNSIDGKFYRIGPDGKSVPMSDAAFPNASDVSWGNASDQAVISFPDGSKILYNFQTKTQSTLPKHWDTFEFSTDDKNIVTESLPISPESRYLVIADPDGKNPQAVQALGENADKVHPVWTGNGEIVAYSETGDAMGYDRQQIILIGKHQENYKGLLVEGRGFDPLWSPTGQKILYSVWTVSNDYKPELWVSGGAPENVNEGRIKLGVQTWAHKCVWADENTIYCAVPENMPRGAGLQPSLYATLEDRVVEIDLTTGRVSDLGKPDGGPSIHHPVITKDGTQLMYTDTQTGNLYSFQL